MAIQNVFDEIKDISVIEALAENYSGSYSPSSFEDVLLPIIEANQVLVVAGGYFGDEGKGKITDAIANNELVQLIARFNSGENAGHTVMLDGKKYVFNLTPSGILTGKVNAIGSECVMDPINYMEKEISQLVNAGIDYKDKLFVGNVHVVGPQHKVLDFALNPPNSSTLMGMSYIHASKAMKRGLRLDHLFNSTDEQAKRLTKELNIYEALMKHNDKDEQEVIDGLDAMVAKGTRKVPAHMYDFLKAGDVKKKVEYLISLYEEKVVKNSDFPKRADVAKMFRENLEKGNKGLIESPQSFNLSNATEKHWPSSTSAQTHAAGVIASALYNTTKYKTAVINVFKTPADSRVGIGANPSSFVPQDHFSKANIDSLNELEGCEDFDRIQKAYFESVGKNGVLNPVSYKDESGEFRINEAMAIASSRNFGEKGATTGKPRVTGVFDCLSAAVVNEVQGPFTSISALDRGDDQDYVGLTVGYVYHNPSGEGAESGGKIYKNGDIIKVGDPYPCDQVLKHCYGITKVMPGWKDTPIGVGKRDPNDPLPQTVQNFIGAVEKLTGLEVISVGNGPETDNLIYVKKGE